MPLPVMLQFFIGALQRCAKVPFRLMLKCLLYANNPGSNPWEQSKLFG